jgi:HAE1 family hydrophobic/amphiphilic exporter-1
MRVYQQIRASIARFAPAGAAALMFVFGIALSASGQTTAPPPAGTAPAATPPPQQPRTLQLPPYIVSGTPLTMEDAVKMALENNLGIQADRMNPEIQSWALARAHGVYAPSLISSFNSGNSAAPPTDFLSSGIAVVTSGSTFSSAGVAQQMKWGGGNYQVTFDGSRGTTDAPRTTYPTSLTSHVNAVFFQPLVRNFKIDSNRLNILTTKITQSVTDLQLQQDVTSTSHNVRVAYYSLLGAIAGLQVAQDTLDLAKQSFHDNQRRVEAGTIAKSDLITAEAEVASDEEQVIIQEAGIQSAEDSLRALIMNPTQPGFWTIAFNPTDQATMAPRSIDVDAAIKNAFQNRTDIQALKKQIEGTDINLKYAQNQKLPEIDLQARYGLTGIGGTQYQYDTSGLTNNVIGTSVHSFGSVLQDVVDNNFRQWSVALNFSYPLGTSPMDALAAQTRIQRKQIDTSMSNLQLEVATAVRDAARQVETNLKRVESTGKAAELAQERLDNENKRFAVGLSTTFELQQVQRDLTSANQRKLQAILDYNVSLVNFDAIQLVPVNGR